jgi:hypothetical protein
MIGSSFRGDTARGAAAPLGGLQSNCKPLSGEDWEYEKKRESKTPHQQERGALKRAMMFMRSGVYSASRHNETRLGNAKAMRCEAIMRAS